jgi:[ribosomal protein S5]-alanine N-acetyltransferase
MTHGGEVECSAHGEMPKLRLIPIDRSGSPSDASLQLDDCSREVCAATASLYEKVGYVSPWLGYLAVFNERIVGACSFKGPPASSKVEIAYFTFPEFEGRGVATSMARELLTLAMAAGPGIIVTAQTLPQRNASTAILEKLGFKRNGMGVDPEVGEVWEWELPENVA